MRVHIRRLLAGWLLATALCITPASSSAQTRGALLTPAQASAIPLEVELIEVHPTGPVQPRLAPLLAQLRSQGLRGAVSLVQSAGRGSTRAKAWDRQVIASVQQSAGSRHRVHVLVSGKTSPPRELALELPTARPVLVVLAKRGDSLLLASVQTPQTPRPR